METRSVLENQIISLSDSLWKQISGQAVIDTGIFKPYLESWHSLALYFRGNAETDISVLVIGDYLEWSTTLGTKVSKTDDPDYRLKLEELLVELWMHVNDIVKYVDERSSET